MSYVIDRELTSFPLRVLEVPAERRAASRFRFEVPMEVRLGRNQARLIDMSVLGARVRHANGLRPGAALQLAIGFDQRSAAAEVRVLASRLITVGVPTPVYESRVQFAPMSSEQRAALKIVLDLLIHTRETRWIDNLNGAAASHDPGGVTAGPVTRCRRFSSGWVLEKKTSGSIPSDGFAVPSWVDEGEIRVMCAAYERLDDEGRQLLRLFAAAA